MIDYAGNKINLEGCYGCNYASHKFTIPCGIAYENDNFTLSQDWELPIVGFFVVSPKRHIEKFSELSSEERIEIFEIVDKTIKILRGIGVCERFNVIFEEKENRHFHIWIMPRHKWMKENLGTITSDIGKVFEYAKKNMRTLDNYNRINEVSDAVREEFKNK